MRNLLPGFPSKRMGLSAFFAALARSGRGWQGTPSGALRLAAPPDSPVGRMFPAGQCPITAVAWTGRNMVFPLDRW